MRKLLEIEIGYKRMRLIASFPEDDEQIVRDEWQAVLFQLAYWWQWRQSKVSIQQLAFSAETLASC